MDEQSELFLKRVRTGRIRDGHGDLHAGNICFTADDIVIYDCIEFAARFRCSDVAADLAFLAMDLDQRCFRGFSSYLVHRYAQQAEDKDVVLLMPFYKAYRAMVRAKVSAMRSTSAGLNPEPREEAERDAMRYFHLAASYGMPPALVLMCGLPGTGKRWIARRVGRPFEPVILRSDATRKILAGLSPRQRAAAGFREGLYSAEHTARTYVRLLEEAVGHLSEGRSVIVDATFSRGEQRAPFIQAAADSRLPWAVIEVTCPESVVRARLEQRAQDPNEISDADQTVYLQARSTYEPPLEVEPSRLLSTASGEAVEALTGRLLDCLVLDLSAREVSSPPH